MTAAVKNVVVNHAVVNHAVVKLHAAAQITTIMEMDY